MEKFWIKRIVRGVAIFFLAIAFFSLLSFIVMNLWNSILVVVLHVGIVSFWQAAGILLLSKILFGFGGGRWRNRGDHKGFAGRRQMMEKWSKMTPEERIKFKQELRNRCGGRGWGREEENFGQSQEAFTTKAD